MNQPELRTLEEAIAKIIVLEKEVANLKLTISGLRISRENVKEGSLEVITSLRKRIGELEAENLRLKSQKT